jgi:putative spermidine/putrescine transport system substrate-binding protein
MLPGIAQPWRGMRGVQPMRHQPMRHEPVFARTLTAAAVCVAVAGCQMIGLGQGPLGISMPYETTMLAPSAPDITLEPTTAPSVAPSDPAVTPAPTATPPVTAPADLAALAKAEGELTVMALPRDWCNYGALLDGFKSRYGITINELAPDAASKDEVAALQAGGASSPDVVDIGESWALQAAGDGLLAPYQVATWADIPGVGKASDGTWFGLYTGTITFEVNTDVVRHVPKTWKDLTRPEYRGKVALARDPTASSEGGAAVWAAALANGGSLDDAEPGVAYFAHLAAIGNLQQAAAKSGDLEAGKVGVRLAWTWTALADVAYAKFAKPGVHITVVAPADGRLSMGYFQAISATAQHPYAARLWEEYLLSDAGQNLFLAGECQPIRLPAMRKAGTADRTALSKIPDTSGAKLVTWPQMDAAYQQIGAAWPTEVASKFP